MILRFTNKAAEKINVKLSAFSIAAENRYCEWITDIVFDNVDSAYFLISNAYLHYLLKILTYDIIYLFYNGTNYRRKIATS